MSVSRALRVSAKAQKLKVRCVVLYLVRAHRYEVSIWTSRGGGASVVDARKCHSHARTSFTAGTQHRPQAAVLHGTRASAPKCRGSYFSQRVSSRPT